MNMAVSTNLYTAFFKRLIDFVASFVVLLVLLPVLIVITVFLWFANDGKPFFIQPRPGKNTRIFRIVKFKTMNDRRDPDGNLLPDSERLTSIGSFIRKSSLDELPQLFNVLKGDMSLIGPRPLLTHYVHLYNDFQNRRHEVRPGITGWAQVNGRNAISWDQKFAYDVWYVDHVSFITDCKIVLKTIKKVLVSEGINAADHSTIEPFNGAN